MNARRNTRSALIASAIAVTAAGSLWAGAANAQMFREPFAFGPRAAASMAIYMNQRSRNNGQSGGATAATAGDSQALVCAGNGQTSATAAGNIMCVIAGDGTNVIINSDQNSNGDQNADAETNQTAAEHIGDILDGETNG